MVSCALISSVSLYWVLKYCHLPVLVIDFQLKLP